MTGSHSDSWANKIGTVFDSRPRVALNNDSRWIDRSEEKKLRNSLACPGVHACLYGPSGSGKTSLAKTILARLGKKGSKFIYVRINHTTTWAIFKSQIVENKQAKADLDAATGIKLGIRNLLPYIEFSGAVEGGELRTAADRAKIIEALTLSNIAQILVGSDICLAIDDVNFASDDLLGYLTDLAKEITDNSAGSSAKVIFVGADDVFLRIVQLEPSLKDRMDEIALGSIEDSEDARRQIKRDRVWRFISDGLQQLGLRRPEEDGKVKSDELQACMRAVEDAADGLPKSIVKLGRAIAEKGEWRNRVSVVDITKSADDMTRRNFQYYRANYRTLVEHLRRDKLLPEICLWMFRNGASRIHYLENLAEDLRDIATYALLEDSLQALSALKFLVITGSGTNVFFARDPLLAHTLGVALSHPEKCGIEQSYFGMDHTAKQLFLRFVGPNDPEKRETIR